MLALFSTQIKKKVFYGRVSPCRYRQKQKSYRIVEEKSMAKSCNREICYFPHPFSSKQHQNLFTSEILPFNNQKSLKTQPVTWVTCGTQAFYVNKINTFFSKDFYLTKTLHLIFFTFFNSECTILIWVSCALRVQWRPLP